MKPEILILVALKHVQANPPIANACGYGICSIATSALIMHCKHANSLMRQILHPIFKKWPEYSGSIAYPVPSFYKKGKKNTFSVTRRSHYAFMQCGTKLFSKTSKYGRSRLRLLDFVINELETLEGKL